MPAVLFGEELKTCMKLLTFLFLPIIPEADCRWNFKINWNFQLQWQWRTLLGKEIRLYLKIIIKIC